MITDMKKGSSPSPSRQITIDLKKFTLKMKHFALRGSGLLFILVLFSLATRLIADLPKKEFLTESEQGCFIVENHAQILGPMIECSNCFAQGLLELFLNLPLFFFFGILLFNLFLLVFFQIIKHHMRIRA